MRDEHLVSAARRTARLLDALVVLAALALVTERLTYAGAWHLPPDPGLAGAVG